MSKTEEVIEKHVFDQLLADHDQLTEKIYQKVVKLNDIGHHEITSEDVCIFLNSLLNPNGE